MKKVLIAITLVSTICVGCKDNKKSKNNGETSIIEETAIEKEEKSASAICLLDKLSIRESASAKGKWITSISLGEKVTLTGEETVDSGALRSRRLIHLRHPLTATDRRRL